MQVEHHVVFGTGGGRDLCCDIYRPQTPNGAGILLLHAGSWRRGDKTLMAGQAEMLTTEGYTCVASEYRLVPESPWPAQLHDVKAALRWMRAHAGDLRCDAERIGALGNSAGGHLGLMLAGTPGVAEFVGEGGHGDIDDHIAALVAFYPATQLYLEEPCPGGIPADGLFPKLPTAADVRAASPVTYARADFPPTFMLHGTADEMVPWMASWRMYEALITQGAPVELHLQAGRPHAYATREPEIIEPAMAEAIAFLKRFL
ncbi:hypothetical protein C2W62_21085 [Candidatus Entotheonella serta]|nr:hypothetical protein C2W62_21085 [Candidatus Entotheonella serta]